MKTYIVQFNIPKERTIIKAEDVQCTEEWVHFRGKDREVIASFRTDKIVGYWEQQPAEMVV